MNITNKYSIGPYRVIILPCLFPIGYSNKQSGVPPGGWAPTGVFGERWGDLPQRHLERKEQSMQSPNRLYKAPTDNAKPQKTIHINKILNKTSKC